jgi:hypothetical protein
MLKTTLSIAAALLAIALFLGQFALMYAGRGIKDRPPGYAMSVKPGYSDKYTGPRWDDALPTRQLWSDNAGIVLRADGRVTLGMVKPRPCPDSLPPDVATVCTKDGGTLVQGFDIDGGLDPEEH